MPQDPRPPKSARKVSCPTCGKDSLFAPSNPWRPFCSERCKTNDLGAWAAEQYRIPVKGGDEEGETPPEPPQ
jgi:endogenous inhibitor of DNA gyrase (YacG/DUF329 family)